MATTFKLFAEKLGGVDTTTYIGNVGEVFYNPSTGALRLSDGSTQGGSAIGGASSAGTEWTRFYFDRGGSTPTGQISNSQEVGANFGTWTETTAANASAAGTSQNATYDPTLTGVSVTNGMFAIPAGAYHIDCSIYFKIYNTSGSHQKYDFYLYGRSIGTGNWAGSYDTALVLPDTSSFLNNDFVINLGGTFVFDATTSSDNEFYIQILSSGGAPVGPDLFPDYGFLNIRKLS